MNKFYYFLIAFLLLFGSFQYGRAYDDRRVIVNQPEHNHIVFVDHCEIAADTSFNISAIWYRGAAYTVDTTVYDNL